MDVNYPLIYKIDYQEKKIFNKSKLGKYYFLFNKEELLQGGSYFYRFDENNIPIVRGNIADNDEGFYYNPQAICQFALSLYNHYSDTNCKISLRNFLNICDWLVNNANYLSDIPFWPSDEKKHSNIYNYDQINLISSMSQSRVISVLLRAYQVSNKRIYKEICDKAILAYQCPYHKGSFVVSNNESVFFEENGKPGILNHLIFSLFGLMDYCRVYQNSEKHHVLLHQAFSTIKKNIDLYDMGWWSSYDNYSINGVRRINPATRHYHNIHIQQLYILYLYTNDNFFLDQYKKFKSYDKIFNRIKMLFYKLIVVVKMGRL